MRQYSLHFDITMHVSEVENFFTAFGAPDSSHYRYGSLMTSLPIGMVVTFAYTISYIIIAVTVYTAKYFYQLGACKAFARWY